jgi:hypothetical protein
VTPTPPPSPLPVILLTGFLGSGKTTLLLRWLSEAPATGLRLGVVMNEFGAESVDSQLINRAGLPLQQVAGGCVCCAPDNELPNAVIRLVQEGNCDYLVVETSGLADPDPSCCRGFVCRLLSPSSMACGSVGQAWSLANASSLAARFSSPTSYASPNAIAWATPRLSSPASDWRKSIRRSNP